MPTSTRSPTRDPRQMKCFRCRKPGHRAAVCRVPAPVLANVSIETDVAAPKCGDNHGSFDCGIPWLARYQPHIDWLTRTVRLRDIDVNAVLAFLRRTLKFWPHVAVMAPDAMSIDASESSDGPSCAACEHATCARPEYGSQDGPDTGEQIPPCPDEQWLSSKQDMVEHGLPHAVVAKLPHVVERGPPERSDTVETCIPYLGAESVNSRDSTDVIEHVLSFPVLQDEQRPVRRRGRQTP
ncbi:hypothetical protein F441_10230 [Phytophthora nicotianae CJ01A1]|uniref:CCHC-type domain-containing protein n=1 Tax=Phytophthora nicotianae CJ01A1 TaxID=1317063 RepID=W2WWI2_PHYNI|nr:hypothetical protein F441_10230 [Phytophthora nicotianae CJ01A1]